MIPLVLTLAFQANPFSARHLRPVPPPNQALVKVNGAEIRAQDLSPFLWDWYASTALQDLIAYRVVLAEGTRLNLAATDEEVEKALTENLSNIQGQLPGGMTLDQALAQQSMPRSRLFLRTKTDLTLDRIALAAFRAEDYLKTRTLVIKPKSESAEDLATAIDKAKAAAERLRKGEAWTDVLVSVSEDPQYTRNDGVLDWRPLEAFPASDRSALAQLPVGGISGPIRTPNGIQVFRVDERGRDLQGEALEMLRRRDLPNLRSRILERLRREAKIELSTP